MMRKVYLDGELGEKYGRELTINATSFAEVFKCLDCNFPGFRDYIIDCEEKGIGFSMEVAEEPVTDERELLMEFREGDMYICPQPVGGKAAVRIIAAVVIAYIIIQTGGAAASNIFWEAGKLTLAGKFAAGVALNLAIGGLAELMAPDPATEPDADSSQNKSYLFQGAGQTIEEGDPVPVVYGELRVPARMVSFDIRNKRSGYANASGFSSVTPTTKPSESSAAADLAQEISNPSMLDPRAPGQTIGSAPTQYPSYTHVFPAGTIHG